MHYSQDGGVVAVRTAPLAFRVFSVFRGLCWKERFNHGWTRMDTDSQPGRAGKPKPETNPYG